MKWQSDQEVELEWEAPPPTTNRGRPTLWKDRLAPLIEQPGEWAKFVGVQAAQATRIKQGVYGPGFEVTTRNTTGIQGTPTIYVRYVGVKEET